jgi:L-asparaginase/Glu-tRNA(Gln) amidotransferase subunit D
MDQNKGTTQKELADRNHESKISIILTGGTIGSTKVYDNIVSENKKLNMKKLIEEHFKSKYNLSFPRSPFYKLSENVTPCDWKSMADAIASEISKGMDGIVVTHGTDTLAYTSSAMSFMLKEVPIPVVFTGAFISPDNPETDAFDNINYSILFASKSEASGIFALFYNNKRGWVFTGNRISSILSYGNSFYNSDFGFFAKIKENPFEISYNEKFIKRSEIKNTHFLGSNQQTQPSDSGVAQKDLRHIDPRVFYFKIYPGFHPKNIEMSLDYGAKGIILELYHSGTGCTCHFDNKEYSLLTAIKRCVERGVPIFGMPGYNLPQEDIYRTKKELVDEGLILLKKMTPESAIAKLMWSIGNHPNEINEIMLENINGEIFEGDQDNNGSK